MSRMAEEWAKAPEAASGPSAWALLQLLPHACEGVEQLFSACESIVASAARTRADILEGQDGASEIPATLGAEASGMLLVEATGRRELLRLTALHMPQKVMGLARSALQVALALPGEFHALDTAAEALEAVRQQLLNGETRRPCHPVRPLSPLSHIFPFLLVMSLPLLAASPYHSLSAEPASPFFLTRQ